MPAEMARLRYSPMRRVGPFWIALTAWEMWRRLPPPVRRRIIQEARKHGPRAGRAVQRAVERQLTPRRK
jgi:hypothetical protein